MTALSALLTLLAAPAWAALGEPATSISRDTERLRGEGPIMPDLEPLLGSHYATFRQAASAGGHRRAPVVLRTEGLVVESGGHMRAFRGRAYLPGILPRGFNTEGVR